MFYGHVSRRYCLEIRSLGSPDGAASNSSPSSEMLFEWQEMVEWVKAKIRTGKNCGISAEDWNLLLEENCTNYEEVDQFYSKLADHMKSNLIAFRWNQCLSYFHNWTMRKNHSWVTIIRNPLSRSASHFESHNSG